MEGRDRQLQHIANYIPHGFLAYMKMLSSKLACIIISDDNYILIGCWVHEKLCQWVM